MRRLLYGRLFDYIIYALNNYAGRSIQVRFQATLRECASHRSALISIHLTALFKNSFAIRETQISAQIIRSLR